METATTPTSMVGILVELTDHLLTVSTGTLGADITIGKITNFHERFSKKYFLFLKTFKSHVGCFQRPPFYKPAQPDITKLDKKYWLNFPLDCSWFQVLVEIEIFWPTLCILSIYPMSKVL